MKVRRVKASTVLLNNRIAKREDANLIRKINRASKPQSCCICGLLNNYCDCTTGPSSLKDPIQGDKVM